MQYETEFQWHIKNPAKHLRWKFLSKQLKTETCELFPQKNSMFDVRICSEYASEFKCK